MDNTQHLRDGYASQRWSKSFWRRFKVRIFGICKGENAHGQRIHWYKGVRYLEG